LAIEGKGENFEADAIFRNLVSALLHHESIKTTLPKAKEAARMAEKVS
jgi:large subunit ribosomal protein L17